MLPLIIALSLLVPLSDEWIEATSHDLLGPQTVETQTLETQAYRGMGSDVEQWRPLVAGHFSDLGQDAVDMALRVMACESGGNKNAANPNSSARGLMQIMASVWAPEFGVTWDQLYEPEINLWVARQVYERQGWKAWTCWRR